MPPAFKGLSAIFMIANCIIFFMFALAVAEVIFLSLKFIISIPETFKKSLFGGPRVKPCYGWIKYSLSAMIFFPESSQWKLKP